MPYIGNVSGFDDVDTEQIKDDAVTADKLANSINTEIAASTSKLSGIETAATADQTNAEIKTAVEAATSIALGGSPTTTTQSQADNSTKLATTAYTDVAIAALADSAPGTLNTLNELAAALGDDASFSTTVTNSIATKLPLAGGAMTGAITTNSTFDGRDVAADGVTADAALPKAGGTMTGDTLHGDNVKAKFGTGGDLEIYHDGSDSIIKDAGTGNLKLQGSDIRINNANSSKSYISATDGGSVLAYHNGLSKLATTATGISITGTATATAFAGDGSALTGMVAGGPSLGTASVIRTNALTISENITIPASSNGMSAGPITIADGYTVTVNGTWSIV